jgi:hypothetical protein
MKGFANLILLPLAAAGPLGNVPLHCVHHSALLTSEIEKRQLPSGDKIADLIKGGKLGNLAGKGLGFLTGNAPPTKAMKVEYIEPKISKDAKRIRLTYGPYKLRAVNVWISERDRSQLTASVE